MSASAGVCPCCGHQFVHDFGHCHDGEEIDYECPECGKTFSVEISFMLAEEEYEEDEE